MEFRNFCRCRIRFKSRAHAENGIESASQEQDDVSVLPVPFLPLFPSSAPFFSLYLPRNDSFIFYPSLVFSRSPRVTFRLSLPLVFPLFIRTVNPVYLSESVRLALSLPVSSLRLSLRKLMQNRVLPFKL